MKGLLYGIFSVLTAMIGYHIHGTWFAAILSFLFPPIAWIYWLIEHDVTMRVIKETFSWFFA